MHRLNQTKTVLCDQQSEYDSTPEEEDHQPEEDQEKESGVENYEMPVTPVKTIDFIAMNFIAFILYRLQTKSKESSV